MSQPIRVLIPLLILGAVAAGGYWLYQNSNGNDLTPIKTRPAEPVPTPTPAPTPPEAPPPPAAAGKVAPSKPAPVETRIAAESDNTNSDAPQGVKGRVLLPGGMPAAQVPVFLMESMMNDPIRVFLMNKSGKTTAPVAYGSTDDDGLFALGIRQPGKNYDLRVASEGHPELTHQSVKVREDDWYDTGDLQLDAGVRVTGRVVDETTKAGVANAMVFLTGSNQAHTFVPTPGRERGLTAITDSSGGFRFDNAPSQGLINLSAEAEGFASASLQNQTLSASQNRFTLEIAQGQPIAGVVVDGTGEPVRGVQVTAQGLSQKTPQTASTTTDSLGTFEFPSLRVGPYQLITNNAAFAENKTPPVLTGDLEVKLVLVQRPWVKLRVKSANGKPIKAYRVSLKRHFPNSPLGIGNVPEFRDRSITPADYPSNLGGEWAVVRGLPAGEFVFQIKERNHAKSLSQPFTVREGTAPAEVEATLTLGATITGTVIDDAGKPVRGAIVSTDMNNALSGGNDGFLGFLKQMIPERHSKEQKRTDGQGRFRMDRLAFADYMVRVSHADYCEGKAMDISLSQAGQVVDIGPIQLARGTVVSGFTTVNGMAVGQIKVSLTLPPDQVQKPHMGAAAPNPQALFSAMAISDNDGRYQLLRRVPPGTYKVQAMRQTGSGNPFEALLDIRETEKTITISAGQDRLKIDFNLPAR